MYVCTYKHYTYIHIMGHACVEVILCSLNASMQESEGERETRESGAPSNQEKALSAHGE
jgi:hypothetical protein